MRGSPAGWLIFGIALTIVGSCMGLFPRMLPKTVQRRREAVRKATTEEEKRLALAKDEKASFQGNIQTNLSVCFSDKVLLIDLIRFEKDDRPFGNQQDIHVQYRGCYFLHVWLYAFLGIHAKVHRGAVPYHGFEGKLLYR